MGKKKKLLVKNNRLTTYNAESGLLYSIQVGSERWYAWLADNDAFVFEGEAGHFTARRETRRGMPYWYAYRRREGKLRKVYLGKPERLTGERLEQTGAQLAEPKSASRLPDKPNSLDLMDSLKTITPASTRIDEAAWSDTPFLLTKVKPPVLPQNLIVRPRLTQRINASLTLICAPSGFGKSTLLNEWRQTRGMPVAWMSLDVDDNEVGDFWALVAAALQAVNPEFGQNLPRLLPTPPPSAVRQMIVSLINEIIRITEIPGSPPCIALILDDYHHINNKDIHQSICFLLEHLPPALQLIISGHTHPPFALGRLRAKGMVAELDTEDLRFTVEEGVDFLRRQMPDIPLAYGEMQVLVKRTEGWIAGLNLVALALTKQPERRRFLAAFAGGHAYLREYFMEDVLQKQPTAIQNFLLRTSILRRLTGGLCDAVTEQTNGQQMLHQLWQENLFLVRLGEEQDWYRYHDLFAQELRSQLQLKFPNEIPRLHRRAAQWYQIQDAPADAVRHLLILEAWEEAAALIERVALRELQQQGEDSRLLRWLKQLPEAVVQQHKTLLSLYIRLSNLSLSPAMVAQFLQRVEQNITTKPVAEQTRNEQDVLAEINRIRRLQETGEALSMRMGTAGEHDDVWRMMDLLMQSQSFYRQQIALGKAEAAAAQAFEMGQTRANLFVTLTAGGSSAHFALLQGNLRRSEQLAHRVLQWVLVQRNTLPEPASISLTVLSWVCYERNQLEQAHQLLLQASEVDPNPTSSNLPVMYSILQARIQVAQGEGKAAQETMRAALHLNTERPSGMWSTQDLKAYQALIYIRGGDLAAAERLLNELGEANSHDLTMLVRAEALLIQERYVSSENILANLIEQHPHGLYTEPLLGARLMLAASLMGQHKVNQARQVMVKAVRLAGPEEFIRPFLDRGIQIVPVLTLVLRTEKLTAGTRRFVNNILQMLEHIHGTTISMPKMELVSLSTAASISKREQEVLRLVSAGLSNKEIAAKLFVSDSTVKAHLKNIYRKLEVNSRVQAVERARALKLL